MKAVVQRIATRASVTVVSSIGRGLCVLIGVAIDDTSKDAETLAKKILGLRIFNDETTQQMWKRSVKDSRNSPYTPSQLKEPNPIFTVHLHAPVGRTNVLESMKGPEAKVLYGQVLDELGKGLPGGRDKVKDGVFGAMMQGPVTIILDTNKAQKE